MAKTPQQPFDTLLGSRIRYLRIRKKLSQQDMARRLNISFQQIQKYERGQNRVSTHRLCQIAEALHCPPSHLLSGLGDQPSVGAPPPLPELSKVDWRLLNAFQRIPERRTKKLIVDLVSMLCKKTEPSTSRIP